MQRIDYPLLAIVGQVAVELDGYASTKQAAVAENNSHRLDDARKGAATVRKPIQEMAQLHGKEVSA